MYEDLDATLLECPICTDYLSIPIKQCAAGHSICGKCIEQLEHCALCRSPFTDIRNYTLENLVQEIKYPCINKSAGCNVLLAYNERESHEKSCSLQSFSVKCQWKNCNFMGNPSELKYHWKSKPDSCRIFNAITRSAIIIKPQSYFITLLEAFNQIFWYRSMIKNGNLYFAVQYIGDAKYASKYFYQINFPHEILHKKGITMSDYCKAVTLTNLELFEEDMCVVFSIDRLKKFFMKGDSNKFVYFLKIFEVDGDDRRKSNMNEAPKSAANMHSRNQALNPFRPNIPYERMDNNQRSTDSRSLSHQQRSRNDVQRRRRHNVQHRNDDPHEENVECCIIL